MLRLAAAVLAAALGVAVLAASAPAKGTCSPGVVAVGSASYRVFCGPAKAQLKVGSKTLSFTGGECTKTGTYFTINIGSAYLGAPMVAPTRPYFGISVGRFPGATSGKAAGADGTYQTAISFNVDGTRNTILPGQLKLSHGRTQGSFSGPLLRGGTASGTFSC